MKSGIGNFEELELIGELRRRFPLIEQLVGKFGNDTPGEGIPWFFGLLLSAANKGEPGACCFVLEKSKGTTALAGVLLALVKLQEEFPELSKNYAQRALNRGQRVRVKPSNHVYEYDGIWDEYPNLFRLKVLGNESSRRSIPIKEVLRLEPTKRVRPKGKVNTPLKKFDLCHLDEMLKISTYGNNSIIRNNVLLYMPQSWFADFVGLVSISSDVIDEFKFKKLSGCFTWGSIGPNGELKPRDSYQEVGDPIIAVTNVAEDLALASLNAPICTKIILVDGARRLANNLQAFDDITDRQRMVILASPDEKDELDLLQKRGCPIWYMSPEEILMGETSMNNRLRSSLVGSTIRAGLKRQLLKVTVVDCHDHMLQKVAEDLEHVADLLKSSEESQEGEQIIKHLYRLLIEYSECCFGVGEETINQLRDAQKEVTQYSKWLDPAITSKLCEVILTLMSILENGTYGRAKTEALLDLVRDESDGQRVIATRTPRTATMLLRGLASAGASVPVLSIPAISSDREYHSIILPSWPNKLRFARLKAHSVTSDIRVLVYPFEKKWVERHQAWERLRKRSNQMDAETRSLILGIEPRLLKSLNRPQSMSTVSRIRPDFPIIEIMDRVVNRSISRPSLADDDEDCREAHIVEFIGDCYALMTEWSKLPKLNQLIDGTNKTNLTFVTTSNLSPGDYVLFRSSGDKEFTRLVAEELLGVEIYESRRNLSERWKVPLRNMGTNFNEVQQRLAAYGLKRTTATVGRWLNNPDCIGPSNFQDIKIIAIAAGDQKLYSIRKDVEEAISQIRGTHITAGRLLTRLLLDELSGRLNHLDEKPVLLETDYGEAWVVQVQKIERQQQKYPANVVNQLRWAEEVF